MVYTLSIQRGWKTKVEGNSTLEVPVGCAVFVSVYIDIVWKSYVHPSLRLFPLENAFRCPKWASVGLFLYDFSPTFQNSQVHKKALRAVLVVHWCVRELLYPGVPLLQYGTVIDSFGDAVLSDWEMEWREWINQPSKQPTNESVTQLTMSQWVQLW